MGRSREPLDEATLGHLLAGVPGPGGAPWQVRVVEAVGSTNAELADAARSGAAAGEVLVAEEQVAGRGRLGRTWTAPARSALTFSVLLRPTAPVGTWGWLPLLVGVAVAEGLSAETGVGVTLKWPNDLLARRPADPDGSHGEGKLAGVLVERADSAAVVGVGLNVTLTADELPVSTATSLSLAGAAALDRHRLLAEVLRALADWHDRWDAADGDAETSGLRAVYTQRCATLGRPVRVMLPGGGETRGTADDVDAYGRLVLETADGKVAVGAGDVLHVR